MKDGKVLVSTCLDCGRTYEKASVESEGDHTCGSEIPTKREVIDIPLDNPVNRL